MKKIVIFLLFIALLMPMTAYAATIDYDANGGWGVMAWVSEYEPGTEITVERCDYVRDNCRFAYWTTSADGTGWVLAPGTEIMLYDDMTLYARWVEAPGHVVDTSQSEAKDNPKTGDDASVWWMVAFTALAALSVTAANYAVNIRAK